MKIGIVTTWLERGAAYVSRLYQRVLEEEHEVHIYVRAGDFSDRTNPDWNIGNITWGKKSLLPVSTPIDMSDFEKWIRKTKIEVIFFG